MLRSIAGGCERRCFRSRRALRCVSKHEGVAVLILRDARTHVRDCETSSASAHHRMRTNIASCKAHHTSSPSRSRGACLRPGSATLLHSPRIEGWAERRETFGCCAKHPLGVHIARERRAPRHALAGPIPVFSCFSADSESSIPGLMISSTHTSSFPRRMSAPGVCTFASLTRKEGGRSAERRSGACEAPVGRIMCVKDARERAFDAIRQALARRLASHDAGRSPLGAPPWRLFPPLIPAKAGIQHL